MDFSSPDDEFLLQAQRKAKRSFLAEEIVAAGYSPELFTLFCEQSKSSDIDVWGFEELQDCVKQFKARYKPGDEAPQEEAEEQAVEVVTRPDRLEIVEDEYALPGTPMPRTAISGVEEITVAIHRTNRDFQWLRSTLQIQFPGMLIPPLPDKEKYDEPWIQKRQRTLQAFCEDVISISLFRYSPFLVSFLSEPHSRFQDSKKLSTKLRKATSIEGMPTPSGTVQCCAGSSKQYFGEVMQALTQSEVMEKKLKRDGGEAADTMKALATQLARLSDSMKALGEVLGSLPNGSVLRDEMLALSVALVAWSKHQLQLSSILTDTLVPFFSDKIKKTSSLRELLKEREALFATYTQAEEKLNEKKEKLWLQGDPSKWELAPGFDLTRIQQHKELAFPCMLCKESQTVQQHKDFYAFYNAQAKRQVAQVFTKGGLEARRLMDLAEELVGAFGSVGLEWRTLESKLDSFLG